MVLRDPQAPRIELAGHIMMPGPTGIDPMDALRNFDELVREWSCNRETRMALEASVLRLQDVIEERDRLRAQNEELAAKLSGHEPESPCSKCGSTVIDGQCTECGDAGEP